MLVFFLLAFTYIAYSSVITWLWKMSEISVITFERVLKLIIRLTVLEFWYLLWYSVYTAFYDPNYF